MGELRQTADDLPQPPLDIRLELSGRGRSPHEIAASSAGKLTIVQGAGRREKDALGILANDFIAQIFTALNPFAEEDPYTDFECGILVADVLEGTASFSTILMRTSKMVIVGDGSVDLESETLDITFNTKPRDGIGLAAAGLVTPFLKLGGRLSSPNMGVNAQGVLIEGGLAIATGGLSLFAKEILDRLTAETGDCEDARAALDESL